MDLTYWCFMRMNHVRRKAFSFSFTCIRSGHALTYDSYTMQSLLFVSADLSTYRYSSQFWTVFLFWILSSASLTVFIICWNNWLDSFYYMFSSAWSMTFVETYFLFSGVISISLLKRNIEMSGMHLWGSKCVKMQTEKIYLHSVNP